MKARGFRVRSTACRLPIEMCKGFGVWGLGFGVGVWGLRFGVWSLKFVVRGWDYVYRGLEMRDEECENRD